MTAGGSGPGGAGPGGAGGDAAPGGTPTLDSVDAAPSTPVPAVLALGSNLGDRAGTLAAAVAALEATPGVQVRAVSPVVETRPVGGPHQPDYLNAVALVDTTLSARALLSACQAIEAAHDRERVVRWGPRTLDVDIVAVGRLFSTAPDLRLPHPRAAERAFVLAPWHAVDPQAVLETPSGSRAVAELLDHAPDRDGVRFRADLRLTP